MTKARTIANLGTGFVNISDTGTEGTKVASGTTAQRGSTAGQIRFNTTTGLAEYYTGTEFKLLDIPPTISSVSPSFVNTDTAGNITFTISGSNFQSGAVVKFIGSDATEITASTTTVNSSSSISAVVARSSFVNAKEPYDVRVINTSGLSGTLDNQINVDVSPTWSTASGQIGGSIFEGDTVNTSVTATDADGDTVSYSVQSGSLPTGLSLNSSTGAITGTAGSVNGDTTSSFTLRATANSKTADRAFNIIILNYKLVEFALLGAGGGGGAQDSDYQTSSDENQGEGGCGSLITASYDIKPNHVLYYYIGQGGTGGIGSTIGTGGTYGGSGGYGGQGQGVAGAGGGNLVGLFMANSISQANALLIAGSGGGGAGRPATGGRDNCNGGGGIPNSDGRGNDGTLGQAYNSAGSSNYPQGGQKNAGGSAQTAITGVSVGNSGTILTGGSGVYRSSAWGGGGGGGAGLFGGAAGASEDSWGGSGGGAGSSYIRGLITDYSTSSLNSNPVQGINYLSGAFTIQSYGHTGGTLSV